MPGFILRQAPEQFSTESLLRIIQRAHARLLRALAAALEFRHDDAMEHFEDARSMEEAIRLGGMRAIARYANSEPYQPSIAQDFVRASLEQLDALSSAVRGGYPRACGWIQTAKQLRSSQSADAMKDSIFVLYLAVVRELSSTPDEDSNEDLD